MYDPNAEVRQVCYTAKGLIAADTVILLAEERLFSYEKTSVTQTQLNRVPATRFRICNKQGIEGDIVLSNSQCNSTAEYQFPVVVTDAGIYYAVVGRYLDLITDESEVSNTESVVKTFLLDKINSTYGEESRIVVTTDKLVKWLSPVNKKAFDLFSGIVGVK